MKSFENTFETPKVCLSCSIWLENHFSRLETKKFLKIFLKIFLKKNFEKLRKRPIVPKNEKGDPLGFINIFSVAKYQKIRRGDSFEKLKIFEKKIRTVPKKIERGDPLESSGFVGYVKKVKKRKEGPFAVSLHWWNLAWVNLSVSVKSGTYAMSSVVWRKKKTSHCNSRAFFLKGKCAD